MPIGGMKQSKPGMRNFEIKVIFYNWLNLVEESAFFSFKEFSFCRKHAKANIFLLPG
jgi:hypothetical protein